MTFAWDASPESEVSGYFIYERLSTESIARRIDVGFQTNASLLLEAGRTYEFYVTAYTGSGLESLPSENLWHTPGGGVRISLEPSPRSDVAGYSLYHGELNGLARRVDMGSALATTLDSLAPGTACYFYAAAYNAAGTQVDEYRQVAYTIPDPASGVILLRRLAEVIVPAPLPAAPGQLTVSPISPNGLRLAWLDRSTNELGFNIYRASAGAPFINLGYADPNVTVIDDDGLQANTTYTYRVTAFNITGESASANASGSTPGWPPSTPSGLSAQPGSALVTLSWQPVAGAAGYSVYRGDSAAGSFAIVAQIRTPGFTNGNLINGRAYYYVVSATNLYGESAWSAVVSAMPLGAPTAPASLTASPAAKGVITLKWLDTSNNESNFAVERSLNGVTFTALSLLPPNTVTYADRSVSSRTRYYYRVRASNTSGSSVSNAINVKAR